MIQPEIFSAIFGLSRLMQAIVIQNGIMDTRNMSVNVPAVIKKSQMKNPITWALVVKSIVGVLLGCTKIEKKLYP